jgi:phage-related protein
MTAIWPVALPQIPVPEGWKETLPKNAIRSSTGDDGITTQQRQRYRSAARPFTASVELTRDQTLILDAFFLDDLGGGALQFSWTNPRTRTAGLFRLTKLEYTHIGGNLFSATLELEQMP